MRTWRWMLRGLVLAFAVSTGPLPALADGQPSGPTLDVSNPRPGNMLTPGSMVIQGVAYDDDAETGVGVDRVSVFLGDRDIGGGALLGDAKLGLPNPQAVEGGDPQFAFAGWSVLTTPLKGTGEQRSLYVFARSSVTGAETVMVIPVVLGEKPKVEGGGDGGDDDEGGDDE